MSANQSSRSKSTVPIQFLGFPIHSYTMEETIQYIVNRIERRETVKHVAINAAKIVYARKSRIMEDAILSSDIVSADGQSIVWGARLLGKRIPERVAGVDLFLQLLGEFEKRNIPVFFLGAQEDVLEQMQEKIKKDYPRLNIAGCRNGYFSQEEEGQVCGMINDSQAQALFLGISSPKKELFLLENSAALNPCFRMGVGGSFDVLAGRTKRAPESFQKAGLEWLYRIYQEPTRMWKRYAVTNTLYLFYLVKELLG